MFLSSSFFQRSAEWFDEDTLFTSGLTVCPLNSKVNEMAKGMTFQSCLLLKLHVQLPLVSKTFHK